MSALFPPSLEEQLARLTPRQRFVYDLLAQRRSAEEIGRWFHAARQSGFFGPPRGFCRCSGDRACPFAEESGRRFLLSLRAKGLVRRKRATGLWERTQELSRNPFERSSQGELPEGF